MDLSGLRGFMGSDFVFLVGVVFCLLAIKYWRESEWLRFAGSVVFGGIIVFVARGGDIWAWIMTVLGWFGLRG